MDLQKIRLIPSHSQLSFLQIVWFLLAGCLVPHAIDAFDWNVKRRRAPELPKGSTLMSSTSCELSLKHENHWKPMSSEAWSDFVKILCFQLDVFQLTLTRSRQGPMRNFGVGFSFGNVFHSNSSWLGNETHAHSHECWQLPRIRLHRNSWLGCF